MTKAIAGLILVVVIGNIIGAILPGPVIASRPETQHMIKVGLVQGPIHTDFLLPATRQTRANFGEIELPAQANWLLVGWGGKEFYTTIGGYGDISLGVLLRTVVGDDSVMRYQPVGAFEPELTISLTPPQFTQLLSVIREDTDFDQPVGSNLLAQGDRYFSAKGRFNLIITCNQWISRSLRRAGHSFGIWTQTNPAVRLSLAVFD